MVIGGGETNYQVRIPALHTRWIIFHFEKTETNKKETFYFEDLSLNPGADLIEIVMVLGRANQSTLFQHSIATILKKLFMI